MRYFASDNTHGVHPRVMEALARANEGFARPYGYDEHTLEADELFRGIFGQDAESFFVISGTGANVLALKALVRSHHAILCAENAHINVDEVGAPEQNIGCKLLTAPIDENAKVRPGQFRPYLHYFGVEHHVQPKVVSITQCTEYGTVYTPEEIRAFADFAHANGMYLHMDGARIANAAERLGLGLKEITVDCGVDVLSFGGTKNGVMFGEAVVFFDKKLAEDFKCIRKQSLQLCSKMRYISAQFVELLKDGLWLENARRANQTAALLAKKIRDLPGVTVTRPVETNHVFAVLPEKAIAALEKDFFFYVWNPETLECRFVTGFNTSTEDVEAFAQAIAKAVE